MEDKSITSMIITVLISVVIVGAVLVPILGEVSDNGGNGGGNGGGSGESEKVVLNTLSDEYGTDVSPYLSTQMFSEEDNLSMIPSNSFTYSLENLNTIKQNCTSFNFTDSIAYFSILDLYIGENYIEIKYDSSQQDIQFYIEEEGGEEPLEFYLSTVSALSISFSETEGLNYSITYTDGESKTITGEWAILENANAHVSMVSTYEYGWIGTTNKDYLEKFTVGSEFIFSVQIQDTPFDGVPKLQTITEDMISDNTLKFTWTQENYSVDVAIEIQPTDTDGVWQFAPSVKEYEEGALMPNGISITLKQDGQEISRQTWGDFQWITTYGYIQSGSGSGSDSGSGGMSNVLLGIIPVFVLLGILIYAVQYLRPDNKL